MSAAEKMVTLEERLALLELPPSFRMQILDYVAERDILFEPHYENGGQGVQKDPAEEKHALLFNYRPWYDGSRREYTEMIAKAIIAALEIKRKDDPARYNAITERVIQLIRVTGDKLILPTYSRKRKEVTRNSSNGEGGVYDIQVTLPNGETLDLIAKQFEREEDFKVDVFTESRIGEGLLAIDEHRRIKFEINKGKTTLTERLSSAQDYGKIDVLLGVAERVIQDLKRAAKSKEFEAKTDLPQKMKDWATDFLGGKKRDRGKRYVVPDVEYITHYFMEGFVSRLAPDVGRAFSTNHLAYGPRLCNLFEILRDEFEPLFQRQKKQVINSDLNGGNILFDDNGEVRTCDRELTKVDWVQKCAYDLTQKQRMTLEQELRIADLFHFNLDTGVDNATFRKIYLIRRVLEDIMFTKYLEYADNPVRADTPDKKKLFEDAALYHFNRALRLAKDAERGLGHEKFVDAVVDTVEIMDRQDQLYLVDDKTFMELEDRVLGCEALDLSRDPLENLKLLFSTEFKGSGNSIRLMGQYPAESSITKRLVIGAAAGLGLGVMVGTCSAMRGCEGWPDEKNSVVDARYLEMSNPKLKEQGLDAAALSRMESLVRGMISLGPTAEDKELLRRTCEKGSSDLYVLLRMGSNEFGTSHRLHYSIICSSSLNTASKTDFADRRIGRLLVPEEYVNEHLVGTYGDKPGEFANDNQNMAASSRYLKYCQIRNNGNIVDTIADYYLGGEGLRQAMIKSGSENYFDTKVAENGEGNIILPGYRNELPENIRKLIETATYFFLHTDNDLDLHPDGIVSF
jgi:hypothetical protein